MIFSKLFSRKAQPTLGLYEAIVAAARRPFFYAEWGVPDTIDGRFDMIVLHLYLALDRLRGESYDFKQALSEMFFSDMDRSIREMGASDVSVAKKMRRMAEAFSGRVEAYEKARTRGPAAMEQAFERNVFGGKAGNLVALREWFDAALESLKRQNTSEIMAGKVSF